MWFPASASVYDRERRTATSSTRDDGKPKCGGIASSADMASGVEGPNIVNPVAQLETMHRRYPRTKIFSTTSLEIKPITSLTLKSEFTADLDMREEDEFSPVIDVPGGSSTSSREQFSTTTTSTVFGKRQRPTRKSSDATTSAPWRVSPPTTRNYISATSARRAMAPTTTTIWYGAPQAHGPKNPNEDIVDYSMVSFLARLGLFVRRPLFPHRKHPSGRIVEAARSKELRLVPGHFGIVETLLGEILPECRSQQGLRPREIPCRLG